jgi:hypothetical protein
MKIVHLNREVTFGEWLEMTTEAQKNDWALPKWKWVNSITFFKFNPRKDANNYSANGEFTGTYLI